MFLQSLSIFSFSYFSQLFVEITCQEIVEKLISCHMVLWIKCFINLISISSICFFMFTSFQSLKMINLSSYVAWQLRCVTFCLDHWYLIIQWTLFNISSWNLCLPFLSLTTTFCLKTGLCLVFLKVYLNCLHCCELTTIWLVLALCL